MRLLSAALPGLVAFGVGQTVATPAASAATPAATSQTATSQTATIQTATIQTATIQRATTGGRATLLTKAGPARHRWTASHGTTAADKIFAKLMRSEGNPDHDLYARASIAELARLGKAVCAVIRAEGGDEARALIDIDNVSGDPFTPEGNSWLVVASEVVYCPDQE